MGVILLVMMIISSLRVHAKPGIARLQREELRRASGSSRAGYQTLTQEHSCDSTNSTFSFPLQEEAPRFTIISFLQCHFLQGRPCTQEQIARSSR